MKNEVIIEHLKEIKARISCEISDLRKEINETKETIKFKTDAIKELKTHNKWNTEDKCAYYGSKFIITFLGKNIREIKNEIKDFDIQISIIDNYIKKLSV